MKRPLIWALLLVFTCAAFAQQSASFKMEQATLASGGHPVGGIHAVSPSFSMSVEILGQGLVGTEASSPMFSGMAGWLVAYLPPGEVLDLRFLDETTLAWNADPAAGDYALYGGAVTQPFDAGYGSCLMPPSPVLGASTTLLDTPPPGGALFVLVTSRNRLAEEGTKGFDSGIVERPNLVPCP